MCRQRWVTWAKPCPFQGRFVVRMLGLPTINVNTKYEVPVFTHYEDMKGDEMCRNWGGLGSTKVICNITYDFLLDFNRMHLVPFRVIARFSSKVAEFNPPYLHLSPQYGVIKFEFRRDIWHQKTRDPGLTCGIICVVLRLAVLIPYQSVTDTHTHRQTHEDGICRTSIASRGKMGHVT